MRQIIEIGKKSKKAFENLKKVKSFKINKALDDYIKLLSKNKKRLLERIKKT